MGYWLKSYTDILDDPKYHRMTERGQLAMHEIFLVAKMIESDELTGLLPCIEDIAFYSRKPIEYWQDAMPELLKSGIVIEDGNGFFIVNYVKRQQAIPVEERMKQYRKRKNDQSMEPNENETGEQQDGYESVTDSNGDRESTDRVQIENREDRFTCAKTSAEPEKTYQDCDDDGLEIPKRKTKKPKDSLYPIANAISNVTGMSLNANRTRIFKEAKLLCADPRVTPEEIIKTYSKNGDWYRLDWRGQKGQKPTLSQIRETIFTFDGVIPPNRPVPKGMPAVLAEFERLKQEVDIGDQV
jgi:hypothetical protein